MSVYYDRIESPVGDLFAAVDEDGALVRLTFLNRAEDETAERARVARDHGAPPAHAPERCRAVAAQLAEYFAGRRRSFDLPLAPRGTDFQRAVWEELARVPYGETISYGELARRVGRQGAARAIGAANGANPLPIVVPCHRVIGADGSLTGYGGGLDRKRTLLGLEGVPLPA
ncbi:MAG TPA: methylated-DNA--[protein]-cysteine S-methyltransferase [Thermoanaerobaculia bacterium]|nr:methylated-DNA--[protein]-cysteine S-methyltransferase [Thermoanaerobaculia bacterium]